MTTPDSAVSRRTVLRTVGGVAVGAGGLALAGPAVANEQGWEVADVPITQPLYAVAQTANGPYAVGEEGIVLERVDDASWEVAVDDGPGGQNRTLYAAGATDDGGRLWFAGDSGALGALDVDDGTVYDFSEPEEIDDTLRALVVDGGRGDERILVGTDSGQTLDGALEGGGEPEWGDPVEPANGATIAGLAIDDDSPFEGDPTVLGADESQNAFRSPDFNGSWETFGVEDTDETFHDVESLGDSAFVATDAGTVHRYDADAGAWTDVDLADVAVRDLDARADDRKLLAPGGEGLIHERVDEEWTTVETSRTADLHGAAYADDLIGLVVDPVDVVVGEGCFVLERDPEF